MSGLTLGLAVAGTLLAGAQAQPPAFRAETYVVVLKVSAFKRSWFGGSKPEAGLTVADFTIVLDEKVYVPVKLEPEPDRPGHYLLSFSPPDDARDGKPRQIQVRFRKRSLPKQTISFPQPAQGAAQGPDPGAWSVAPLPRGTLIPEKRDDPGHAVVDR